MGQADALRSMDAAIFTTMESAGFASRGHYTAKGSAIATPVRFYLDNPEQDQIGGATNAGGAVKQVTQLSLFLSDVPDPRVGDLIVEELAGGVAGDTFELANKTGQDASLSIWRARRGG